MEIDEFREFAEGLRAQAELMGACPKGMKGWDSGNADVLVKLWKHFIDFGIELDWPTLQDIDRFDEGVLHANGVWVDHEFADDNWELPDGGVVVLCGTCTGVLRVRGFRSAVIYVRHTSDVRIESYGEARVRVYIYDTAVVTARHYGAHKIRLAPRSESCEVRSADTEYYYQHTKQWL